MHRRILLSKSPMAACIAATPSRAPASEPRDTSSLPGSVVVWNHEERILGRLRRGLVRRDGSRGRLAPPWESAVCSVARRAEKSKRVRTASSRADATCVRVVRVVGSGLREVE